MPGAATAELCAEIEKAGPFGMGAPAPRFAFPDCAVRFAKRVGEGHLKIALTDGMGATLDAIAFGAFDGPLGPALEGARARGSTSRGGSRPTTGAGGRGSSSGSRTPRGRGENCGWNGENPLALPPAII
jgi:hypothetical protein